MHAHTLSFRASDDFVEQTIISAKMIGLTKSNYVREAVREKNDRAMAEHIAALSRKLSANHLAFNESMEDTLTDGF